VLARSVDIKTEGDAGMDLAGLQADLRHFAAERDWQPFHTPKNLSTALMVEAAELAEIFQWMTPQASQLAHQDAGLKQRIGEEVADVLLYLLQLADHSRIDIEQAVKDKLARNALKHPATRGAAPVSPARAAVPGTHVLLDYENVQPTADELRALVPDARQVWVFHGPHQRQVEQRFASFGADVAAVPISRPGKNALDFHLSFYMGYIASLPISVRPSLRQAGRWMPNFGARRLRASRMAGVAEIPAFIDTTADSYDQVIENEQREGLKPLDWHCSCRSASRWATTRPRSPSGSARAANG
jgi:NTP pyrophosphatase (non-canonical NTP hydrolase)